MGKRDITGSCKTQEMYNQYSDELRQLSQETRSKIDTGGNLQKFIDYIKDKKDYKYVATVLQEFEQFMNQNTNDVCTEYNTRIFMPICKNSEIVLALFKILKPNETTYYEIVLNIVEKNFKLILNKQGLGYEDSPEFPTDIVSQAKQMLVEQEQLKYWYNAVGIGHKTVIGVVGLMYLFWLIG